MRAVLVALAVLRLGLRLELGPEFDSNANHAANLPAAGQSGPVESFVLRGNARGRLVYNARPHLVRLTLDVGGKWFFADAAGPQRAAVVRLLLEERSQLTPLFALGVSADYHDLFQPNACPPVTTTTSPGATPASIADTSCKRDFRQGSTRLTGTLAGEKLGLAIDGGLRGYQWKPDNDLSFYALGAGLTPSLRLRTHAAPDEDAATSVPSEYSLTASGRVEWRSYAGPALLDPNELVQPNDPRPRRADLAASFGLQLAYSGPILASAGYFLETTSSNSAGAAYLYQALTLGLTAELPAALVASVRAQLLFYTHGPLPVALAVEDENRDSLLVDLSREIAHGLSARVRYAVYRNAAADLYGGYVRQVVYLAAAWELR